MEWRSPPNWAATGEKERIATGDRGPATERGPTTSRTSAEHASTADGRHEPFKLLAANSSPVVTTGEAMDVVAAQCERRGLTSAATWLSEMSLHALPSVLAVPLSPAGSLVAVVTELDRTAVRSPVVPSSSTPLQLHHQRLHRVALGYLAKGEFQRCHQIILREIMRSGGTSVPPSSLEAAETPAYVLGVSSLPSPEVVRGFRTTTVPSLLQFLSLYALFMDGMKAKQLSNNANAGGGGGAGSPRAVHPHARVLRAYLLEAMRNPINLLRPPALPTAEEDVSPCRPVPTACPTGDTGGVGDTAAQSAATRTTALPGSAVAEGWDPHTPSAKKQPWTITSASRVPGVRGISTGAVAGGASTASTAEGSSVGSQAFSNFSPATHAKNPIGSPAVATPAHNVDGASPPVAARVGASDLLHLDPYLTWLMGVVLRELRMRQECATFLLAAVTVNPLLRCAWEDLTSLVSRETQLAELDVALDGAEPFFMLDIFAAEVRGLLGVTPVSSSRLRSAAADAGAARNVAERNDEEGQTATAQASASSALLSAASPHAINGADVTASGARVGTPEPAQAKSHVGSFRAKGAQPLPSSSPPPPQPGGLSTAALTNAWECLGVLFPDTPHLLSQLAHFYYHQRNRLDKAEAIYQRIRVLDPHYYGILYDYSNVLYTKRDRLGLSSLVQSVYHADAFRAETNFAVGNYYVLLGQHDRAALHFHRTTAIDPQCAEAWLLLGHAYVEVKNTTAAVEAYRAAVELNERDYRGWYNLGQIYELLEAYHHALYYYWHTTSLRPADPGMWVAVANCLEHDGRVAESIACLERAETYDMNTSPNYPAYVRRIATHHIANSSFTRACVYLEKLAQSPAATGEDLLLALPFLIQHYVQRARKSMEVSARSSSYDPTLFSPGVNLSPASSPASVAAGRTALHHARAAAALQHLHRAEEHLNAMAELVMPMGTAPLSTTDGQASARQQQDGSEAEAMPMAGLENFTDDLSASGKRRSRQATAGAASSRASNLTSATAAEELPPVTFVRSRHNEINFLKAQALQLLHPPAQQQQQQQQLSGTSIPTSTAASFASSGQPHQRGFYASGSMKKR